MKLIKKFDFVICFWRRLCPFFVLHSNESSANSNNNNYKLLRVDSNKTEQPMFAIFFFFCLLRTDSILSTISSWVRLDFCCCSTFLVFLVSLASNYFDAVNGNRILSLHSSSATILFKSEIYSFFEWTLSLHSEIRAKIDCFSFWPRFYFANLEYSFSKSFVEWIKRSSENIRKIKMK